MNREIIRIVIAFIISFFCTYYLVPLCKKLAIKLKFIDVPDGIIKRHTHPIPYLGGVAVYIGFLIAFIITFPVLNNIALLLAGATFLLFVGLADDFIVMKSHQKFIGQAIAAICFLKTEFCLKDQFFSNYWNVIISFFWIMTVINAFNLVDVMDGLATLLATCAATTFLLLALYFNLYDVALLLSPFIGALLAFFAYNYPPASIYLGDAGALFIGGFLATIPFLFNWSSYCAYGYFTAVLVLAIPLLEVGMLILIRTYKKIPFYCASPDHFSLYLLKKGWSKKSILLYVLTISLFLGLISFLFVTQLLTSKQLVLIVSIALVSWSLILFKKS